MADNTPTDATPDADNSIFTNLKNKVTFKVRKAVTDPEANKFASEQKQKQQQEQAAKEQALETKKEDATENKGDPNKFSGTRLIKKVGSQTLYILKMVFFPFIALMLSMIVANEMIIYTYPVRILFFIFTFLLCFFIPFYAVGLAIFYVLKAGYGYYVNNMTNGPKRQIMPRIYSLLPISTYQASSSLGSFFMYPFSYPKSDKGAEHLVETMKQYYNSLLGSFPDFNTIKNLEPFVQEIKKIQENFTLMHKPTFPTKTEKPQQATTQVTTNTSTESETATQATTTQATNTTTPSEESKTDSP